MKTTILHITLFLSCAISAQTIWYKPDLLVAHQHSLCSHCQPPQHRTANASIRSACCRFPATDSVPAAEEYTVVTVLRNLEPDSAQLLWCFTANDTLREAVLTNGIFRPTFGVCTSSNPRINCNVNICYFSKN